MTYGSSAARRGVAARWIGYRAKATQANPFATRERAFARMLTDPAAFLNAPIHYLALAGQLLAADQPERLRAS